MQTLTLTDEEAHLLYRAGIQGLKGSAAIGADPQVAKAVELKLLNLAQAILAKVAGG